VTQAPCALGTQRCSEAEVVRLRAEVDRLQRLSAERAAKINRLIRKLGLARGMLGSAQGVLDGTLPREDCTPEEIAGVLAETAGEKGRGSG
jgi:hypothetical protein